MIQKIKNTFQNLISKEQQSVIETDYEKSIAEKQKFADKEWCCSLDDPSEQVKCKQVKKQIEEGLTAARELVLRCEILVPCGLTTQIARDILIMSESEPCGVRGCLLIIHLQDKTEHVQLIRCQYDHSTVSTFEIHLTLQEDTGSLILLRKLILKLTGCFRNSTFTASPKMLCLAYKLEKLKLYRSVF